MLNLNIVTLWASIFSFCNNFVSSEVIYVALFEGSFKDCDDFDNSKFIDVSNLFLDSSSATDTYLQGYVNLLTNITDQDIKIEIYQCGEMADEVMMTVEGSVCEQVKKKDTPWHSVFEAMSISGCPIITDRYDCKKMTIDLSSAQPYLTHQYVGLYKIVVTIFTNDANRTKLACVVVLVGVIEINDDDE